MNHHVSNLIYPLLIIAGLLLAVQVCQAPTRKHHHVKAGFPYPNRLDTLKTEVCLPDTSWAEDHRYMYDYFKQRMILIKPEGE